MDQDTTNKLVENMLSERNKFKQEVKDLQEQNVRLDEELKKYMIDMAEYIEMTDSTISVLKDEVIELKAERDSYKDAYERLLMATIGSIKEDHINVVSSDKPKKDVRIKPRLSKAQEEIKRIKYGILPKIKKED